jgi:hypothetical protein
LEPLDTLVQQLGVNEQISKVLFVVFPDNEFAQYFDLFEKAVKHPQSLQPFISELRNQFNIGTFCHTMGAINQFLSLENFEVFTRDVVRRCCDIVEWISKRKVAGKLGLRPEIEQKPLGVIIAAFQAKYAGRFPDGLLDTLALFNKVIYCPAKHEMVTNEDERKYSVADAIAVTFIAIRLCQRLDDFQKKYPFV